MPLIFSFRSRKDKNGKGQKISLGEKTEIPPDYGPLPLATTGEIKEATTKKKEDFIKISLVVRDEEIKVENDIADQKTKKTMRYF